MALITENPYRFIFLLIIGIFVKSSKSSTITCEYQYVPGLACLLNDVTINNPNDPLIIEGNHTDGNLDSNVLVVEFYDSEVKFVPAELFQKFKNLQVLGLERVKLENLSYSSFEEGVSLVDLSLRFNSLKVLPTNAFENCKNLKALNCEFNEIAEISEDTFVGLSNLQNLYLGGNQIVSLQPNTFKPLSKLAMLNLFSNKIKELPSTLLKNSQNLLEIYLHRNSIKLLQPEIFESASQLQHINLNSNNLRKIDGKLFSKNSKLSYVSIANNNISAIGSDFLDYVEGLRYLDLYGNICVNETFEISEGNFTFVNFRLEECFKGSSNILLVSILLLIFGCLISLNF